MERFAAAAGIKFVHVPYPGLAPAMRDLLAGHIDAIFDTPGNTLPHVANGGVRALAVTGATRLSELPDAPPIADTLPGIVHTDWFAVVAPPKTPPEIATRLSQAIAEAMKQPDVAKRIAEFRVTAVGGTPAETGALIKREAEQYRALIAATGIKVEKIATGDVHAINTADYLCSSPLRSPCSPPASWRKPPTRTGPSRSSCRRRRARISTPFPDHRRQACHAFGASRSSSSTARAQRRTSAPRWSRDPSPTATRSLPRRRGR